MPSLTEYVFFLGAGEHIVGITDYCIVPAAEGATKPELRGTKNPMSSVSLRYSMTLC